MEWLLVLAGFGLVLLGVFIGIAEGAGERRDLERDRDRWRRRAEYLKAGIAWLGTPEMLDRVVSAWEQNGGSLHDADDDDGAGVEAPAA